MSVRDAVIHRLANSGDFYASGEEMADELGVSRAAIWKAVQRLQAQGYAISGTQSRGYHLDGTYDVLTECGIMAALDEHARNRVNLVVKDVTGSTIDDGRELHGQGAPEFTVIAAAQQNAGRGRRGRSFFSPPDAGVYLGIVVEPDIQVNQSGLITGAAAVAVCRAIQEISGGNPKIKWVNDIYLGDKKACGILTEGVADLESGGLSCAVVGIGLNVYEPEGGYPEEIAQRAGAIAETVTPNLRNRIAASVVSHFIKLYEADVDDSIVEEYQSFSMMQGKRITVHGAKSASSLATALGVNDDLSLRVRYDDGTCADLQSGEVSIVIEQRSELS